MYFSTRLHFKQKHKTVHNVSNHRLNQVNDKYENERRHFIDNFLHTSLFGYPELT